MGEEKNKIKDKDTEQAVKDGAGVKDAKVKNEDKNNSGQAVKEEKKGDNKEHKAEHDLKESPKDKPSVKETGRKTKESEDKDKSKTKEKGQEKTVDGLDELPEEIQKKLEKMKAERDQKHKKSKKIRRKKKREQKTVTVGKAYIKSTYNNTIVTLTDLQGDVISWASAGIAGFKGPKKSTPYAAQIITRLAVAKARQEYGLKEVSVFVRGVGTGRESCVRALNSNGLFVTSIKDVTPMPHNGCRPKKPRRV